MLEVSIAALQRLLAEEQLTAAEVIETGAVTIVGTSTAAAEG
jgi:hypothetical protein